MAVLFVHERASFTGGVEQNIADSVHGLKARGVECHLAYSGQFPVQQEFLHRFDSSWACKELNPVAGITPARSIAEVVERVRPKCLYFHKLHRLPEGLKELGVRTVQMVHDHDLCCPRRHKYFAHSGEVCNQPAGLRCYLDGAFLVRDRSAAGGFRVESIAGKLQEMKRRSSVDSLLVASDFMQQELIMNGFPAAKVTVLPLAVRELPKLQAAGQGERLPTVLYVGQLIRGKGVDLLLQSLARLTCRFRCVIVGTGNAEARLRELCRKLGLQDRVQFAGWVDNRHLSQFYAEATVVAVPSRWPEPFGMVGLEAMRFAKPVVAFRVGGIPDWLRHELTGLVVAPQDTAAFAAALESLLQDRTRAAALGVNGFGLVAGQFSFDVYIDRLLQSLLPGRQQQSVTGNVFEEAIA